MLDQKKLDFEQIYAEYQPKIFRYLSRLTNAVEAEDLTQDVFLKVSRALERFRGDSQVSTWLYRIATNSVIDHSRSVACRQNTLESRLDDTCEAQTRVIWTDQEEASLEEMLLEKQRFNCFTDFIQKLPMSYRLIVILSELEQLTSQEIAAILGLSQEAVKIRLHRGRERLFQELKEHCQPEEWL
jgi:RNA polymerase sigma-70 factor (ECF subfamily)